MFGGSVCASADLLPPAGEGWHSLVEVRDGNAQPLGKPLARGSIGIPSASLPAAAHAPVKNSQRQRKEKQRQYDNHPDALRTIRHGSVTTGIAEEHSVPEGRPKSEQAPIRRPPCARRATAPERAKRFSLWTVHGPFLFWQDKRELGGASPLDQPPCGSRNPPWPPSGGPSHVTPSGRCAPADSPW